AAQVEFCFVPFQDVSFEVVPVFLILKKASQASALRFVRITSLLFRVSEVLLIFKIKDIPKMFDETETERVRKLIRLNDKAKQNNTDQSFSIPQDIKSKISNWLTDLNQWNGKEISMFPSYDYVLTTNASESGTGATLKKGNKIIKT
ncbi:hypothetical protein ACTFIR_009353, partial [Dictyostelium discoideum]